MLEVISIWIIWNGNNELDTYIIVMMVGLRLVFLLIGWSGFVSVTFLVMMWPIWYAYMVIIAGHIDGIIWMETLKKMLVVIITMCVTYNVNGNVFMILMRRVIRGVVRVVMIRRLMWIAMGKIDMLVLIWYVIGGRIVLISYKLVGIRMLPMAAMIAKNVMMIRAVYTVMMVGMMTVLE